MWTSRVNCNDYSLAESFRRPESVNLVLIFGEIDKIKASNCHQALENGFSNALIVGCSTGTSIFGDVLNDAEVHALAVGFDKTSLELASTSIKSPADSREAGILLGNALHHSSLRFILILSEGIAVNGSALVDGVISSVGSDVIIAGGLAGDGARFERTAVMANGSPEVNIVSAIGFYGDYLTVGTGLGGGWREFGPVRTVTRSLGNTLYELDGGPALDLYERYLGEEAADLPASGLFYPLRIRNPNAPWREAVRTILSIDKGSKSLTFAGDIPQGYQARLMRGQFDNLVDGAEMAARRGLESFRSSGFTGDPDLCLMISCVGRRLLLGQRCVDEVTAVVETLGSGTPLLGFYGYGEISRHHLSDVCGLHNQSVSLILIAETV